MFQLVHMHGTSDLLGRWVQPCQLSVGGWGDCLFQGHRMVVWGCARLGSAGFGG